MSSTAVHHSNGAVASTGEAVHKNELGGGVTRLNALDKATTVGRIVEALERDGGLVVENLITREHAARIKREVGPHLDNDGGDLSDFFPKTTQRISSLIGKSVACEELAVTPLAIQVANALLTSVYKYREGEDLKSSTIKPILSGTAAFRIRPGSTAQVLHRDDIDFHPLDAELPVLFGVITATTRTTKENGATRFVPGSHKWRGTDQIPREEEATYAELEIGDALFFLGNSYHGGSANTTKDDVRETIGFFYGKGHIRPAENFFLEVPVQKAAQLSTQMQRLLGYGATALSLGVYDFQDPMKAIFKVSDEETLHR